MTGQEARQSPGAKPGFFYGNIVVVAALCIMVVNWGTYYAFGVFFKPVLTEFGWTRAMTSGAFSLSMIVSGLIGIVTGGLTDRLGPRMVIALCGLLLGSGYLLMSQIDTIWQLYLFYGVIIGIGMSGAWVPILSTVARWFVKRRGMMTGIVLTGTGTGALIAPLVASLLISTYDWRMSYIITGSVVLLVVISVAQLLRRDPAQMGQVPYGGNEGGVTGLRSGTDGLSFREAVCTRQFWLFSAMLLCFGFPLFAILVHIVPHAIELGIPAASAASILSTIGGLNIVGRIVLGTLGDRIGHRQVFVIGFILISAVCLWLVSATEMWMLYLFAAIFGFAQGGMGAAESPLVARLFGLSSHGLIFGVAGLGFTVGGAIGPLMTGYIFDLTRSYQAAFVVYVAIGIVGLVVTLLLTPIKGEGYKKIKV